MSLFKDIKGAIQVLSEIGRRNAENPAEQLTQEQLVSIISGEKSTAGKNVTGESAMQVTAVLACVRLLTSTYAGLSTHVYERLEPKGRRRATEHPVYDLLHDRPNPRMSAYSFKERMLTDVLVHGGNAYAEIEWGADGYPRGLWPLNPYHTEPVRLSRGRIAYDTMVGDGKNNQVWYRLEPRQVLHIPAMGDGIKGRSLISYAAESIGNALATNEYANRFFSNGAQPGGVLEHPQKLSDAAQKRLRHSWQAAHGGLSESHRVAVLEEGMKWHQTGVTPQDAQALEVRKFNVTDIARIFLIPPHMIGDVERSTSWGTGIEQQNIGYLVYALRPWLVRFEQEFNYKLFPGTERGQYYVENLVDSLLRGDTKTRNEAYQIMRQNGIINADEWRELENMNPLPDGKGEAYLVPLNMGVAGEDGNVEVPTGMQQQGRSAEKREEQPDERVESRRDIEHSFRPVMKKAAERTVRREAKAIREQMKKSDVATDPEAFRTWLRKQYEGENIGWIRDYFEAGFDGLFSAISKQAAREVDYPAPESETVQTFRENYKDVHATRHAAESRGEMDAVVRDAQEKNEDYTKAVEKRLEHWEAERPDDIARDETNRAGNGIAKAVWNASGVLSLIWNAYGESCPACRSLNGKVVGMSGNFVSAGEKLEFPDQIMSVSSNVSHPPLHSGCDCHITPGGF